MSVRRRWALLSAAAGTAALMIAGVAGAGTAAQPEPDGQVSVVASCLQPPAVVKQAASVDYFLKIEGVQGESVADRHRDEIDIDSFDWAISENALLACETSVRRSSFQPILLTKVIDRSSPRLMQAAAAGTHFPSAVLSVDKAGDSPLTFTRIKLTDVVVSGYALGGAVDTLPADRFGLNYATITVEYVRQASDGGAGETVSFCWNVRQNRVCPASPPAP